MDSTPSTTGGQTPFFKKRQGRDGVESTNTNNAREFNIRGGVLE